MGISLIVRTASIGFVLPPLAVGLGILQNAPPSGTLTDCIPLFHLKNPFWSTAR